MLLEDGEIAGPSRHRLYPPLEPYACDRMEAGDGHSIYYEQCGNPHGLPVVVLHGGPASGCSPLQRRFFDPAIFRIVLFDQRGCGRSMPRGSVVANDTPALVRDIEQLRRRLGIERWIVFGGSWGASLAIAYAADHLSSCSSVILRGAFLTGSRDLDWFFGGAGALLPVAWQELVGGIGLPLKLDECEHAGHAVLAMLKRRLESEDLAIAGRAAAAWARWEDTVSRPGVGAPAASAPTGSPGTGGGAGAGSPRDAAPEAPASLPPSSRDLVDKYPGAGSLSCAPVLPGRGAVARTGWPPAVAAGALGARPPRLGLPPIQRLATAPGDAVEPAGVGGSWRSQPVRSRNADSTRRIDQAGNRNHATLSNRPVAIASRASGVCTRKMPTSGRSRNLLPGRSSQMNQRRPA
jgi:pimeloyl-ACP methyl ester carboxylesterase